MDISIRPMKPADKAPVMDMLSRIAEFKPFEVTVAEEVIDSYFNNPQSGYYIEVAVNGSSVVGYVCYGPTPLTEGTWDIYWIATCPEVQRQGIGRALLKYAEARIKEGKGRMVFIETSSKPEYEKTRLFYDSFGYRTAADIADFYAPGDGKLILEKRLNQ